MIQLHIGFIGRTRGGDVVEYLGESGEEPLFPAMFSDGVTRTLKGKVFTIADSPNDVIEEITKPGRTQKVDVLLTALEYYAFLPDDNGETARKALTEYKGSEND